jgi:hypothetical protein
MAGKALTAVIQEACIQGWTARRCPPARSVDELVKAPRRSSGRRPGLNREIKRRTDAAGIFPDEAAVTRLLGALLLEQPDQPAVQRARRMTLETTTAPPGDTTQVSPPVPDARPNRPRRASRPTNASRTTPGDTIHLTAHGHWKSTTSVGGLTTRCFVDPLRPRRGHEGAVPRAWVEQMSAPEMRPGDIVLMDNLAAQK